MFIYITLLFPLEERPKYLGSLGSAFGISSILGPILGGYLTSVSWRWCFWINVPIGGLSLILLFILAPNRPSPAKPAETWRQKFLDLDPIGFLLVAGAIVCLLFALEFGKEEQQWSSGRVIALFVIFAVLFLAFAGYQVWRKEKATVPPRIIFKRTVLASCLLNFTIGSVLVIYAFYIPVWFQVVKGKSPEGSGIALLPLLLSNVLFVIVSGILVSAVGYFTPFSIAGSAILVIGAALICTWTADVSQGKWIGYQVCFYGRSFRCITDKSADHYRRRHGSYPPTTSNRNPNRPLRKRRNNWSFHPQFRWISWRHSIHHCSPDFTPRTAGEQDHEICSRHRPQSTQQQRSRKHQKTRVGR